MRLKNLNRIIIACLNINSLRSKFHLLTEQVKTNVDVLVISKTKLESSFPEGQFKIPAFSTPFPRDRDQFGGYIMVFVREDILSKLLSLKAAPVESLYIDLSHLNALRKSLGLHTSEYENKVIMGDLNSEINETCMQSFCELYGLNR